MTIYESNDINPLRRDVIVLISFGSWYNPNVINQSKRGYHHIAFKILEEDFDNNTSKIVKMQQEIASQRQRVSGVVALSASSSTTIIISYAAYRSA